MKTISVVVPVYNLAELLPRCMSSLLMQTDQDYEIILVDDGSQDGSGDLCDRYALQYPDIVRCLHKVNGGLSSARNAGMQAAEGQYVTFPDPDDWTEPDYLARFLELARDNQADLVCTGHFVEYPDHTIEANPGQTRRMMSGKQAQEALLNAPCMCGFAWNKLYRLDLIREHGLHFLDDVGTTEDLDFAYRYLQYCSRVCFAPEVRTYHYFQRNGAATHSEFSIKKMQSIRTYEKIIHDAGEDSTVGRAAMEEICNTAMNLMILYFNSPHADEQVYDRLRMYIRRYYPYYRQSRRFGTGRKLQAFVARYMPRLYGKLKQLLTRR